MPNADNEPQIPKNQSPISDDRTGMVSRDWYRFFLNLLNKANQGGGGAGTVTSVNVSGGTTGLTTSGGPVTTSGTITLAGTLDVDNGGTGATTAAGARTNLSVPSTTGSGASGTWAIDITGNAANVTGTVAIANGGTGQTTAAAAITALTGTQTSGYYLRSDGTNAALGAIQAADVPTLNQNTTGQAGSVANALTAGTGISYSAGTTYNGSTAITINNSAPDQTVVLTGGTGISTSGTYPSFTITNTLPDQTVSLTGAGTTSISGTYPNFTITSNDQYVGTVTSVSGTGTVNGISLSGTVTSSGSLTLGGALTGVDLTTQVTGTLPIANGGTGQTTASAAFNALSPVTSTGDLILGNGVNSSTRLPIGANTYVLTSNGTTATWALPTGSGATITNDTTTATNVYPTFAAATSGSLSTIYTSNAKLLYKPSTGELTSTAVAASNGIFVNSLTIGTSYTIPAGYSGMSAGTVTVSGGVTVTVPSGSRWVVV
jgi:hypothetical protein